MQQEDLQGHWQLQHNLDLGPDDRPLGPPSLIGPFTGPPMGEVTINLETGDFEITILKSNEDEETQPNHS